MADSEMICLPVVQLQFRLTVPIGHILWPNNGACPVPGLLTKSDRLQPTDCALLDNPYHQHDAAHTDQAKTLTRSRTQAHTQIHTSALTQTHTRTHTYTHTHQHIHVICTYVCIFNIIIYIINVLYVIHKYYTQNLWCTHMQQQAYITFAVNACMAIAISHL